MVPRPLVLAVLILSIGAVADAEERCTIPLREGEAASVTVEQRGIDVVLRVNGPEGKLLIETDDEARLKGTERLTIVADKAATYELTIKPRYPRMPAGEYVLEPIDIHPATDTDRVLYKTAALATSATAARAAAKMEDYRSALIEAESIAENEFGPNNAYVATLIMKAGFAERDLGHHEQSLVPLERAKAIFDATVGHEHPLTARAIEGIGLAYLNMDDLAKAEQAFSESQAIIERTLGKDHPRVMDCLLHMSALHQNLENPQAAIEDLQRSLPIGEKYLDPDDFQITTATANLGSFYREMDDYDRAQPLLEKALHRIEKKFGVEHPFVAIPLQELAIIARERKHYDLALELLWRAERAREKAYGYFNSQTASSLIVIANVYDAEGNHDAALPLRDASIDVLDTTAGPYHTWTLSAISGLVRTYAARGDYACALEAEEDLDTRMDKAIELNLAIGSEREKLTYATSTADRTDRAISLHVNSAPDDSRAAAHALLIALQRKGRVLDAMGHTLATLRSGMSPEDQVLLDQLRDTTAELAKVALAGPGKTPGAAYRAKLKKLEDDKEALEAKISAHSVAFRAQYRPVTVAAVRDAIPRDAALVELIAYRPYDATSPSELAAFGEQRYVAYVVRRHGRVAFRDLGSTKEIDALVAKWRDALRDPERKDANDIARALDRRIMQPLRPLVRGVSHLLIAPDGQLGLIPFEALVDAQRRHLVEKYQITYLTSGRDLLGMSVQRPKASPAVIVADPRFGEPAANQSSSTARSPSTLYFTPLAGTRQEAEAIKEMFPRARVLSGDDATKAALRQLEAPRILHIATHGFFLDTVAKSEATSGTRSVNAIAATQNPLLRSGLALSGANLTARGNNDGVLTALEASTLNLWGTRLVTLSACDSGVGEVKDREGVYGLRRAFTLAGAETVVMSLWPISDYVTRQMMTTFYRGLKNGAGRGAALRDAELAMLKKHPHPFYWASFIQSGDWKPLQ